MTHHSNRPGLREALQLILVTDPKLGGSTPVEETVRLALEGGCRAVQLRDKDASARELLARARALRELTRQHGALLFVNDRADVALASGADGVHVGPNDVPVAALRAWLGDRLIIGYSTDDPAEAVAAVAEGADYLGCGAVFGTTTKDVGSEAIGIDGLEAVATAVQVPVVGIGGVDLGNVSQVARSSAAGVAVVRGIMAAPSPAEATRSFLEALGRTYS
jgi:thiamine-phosphate pyrophosphorylase